MTYESWCLLNDIVTKKLREGTVVKTSLNLTFGAIGPKLSVIHHFTDKHSNSLFNTFRHSTA